MDIVTISTPEWITQYIEGYEKEVQEAKDISCIPEPGRKYIWKWCTRLGLYKHGLPGQVCYLLERYLAKTLFSKLNDQTDSEAIEYYMRDIKGKIKLIAGCCILLALKMSKRENGKMIQKMIFKYKYTTKDIIKTEAKVFQALDFYIPSRTTVEIAHLLAAEINVPSGVFDMVDKITSQAELHKPSVIKIVQWVADFYDTAVICRLHLAAGSVAAAAYYVGRYNADPALLLGHLTHASKLYINTIAGAILRIADYSPEFQY